MPSDILIVDDEADIRDLVSGILEDEGHRTRLARDADEALRTIEERRPHLVILDIWLQGSRLDGLEVLSAIKKEHPDLPVVIISGHGNIETAVTAIKRGAYDYIEKPFKADRLLLVTLRALEASQLRREVRELRERSTHSSEMVGKSAAINQLRHQLDKVAPTNSRILIRGSSGSGKELAARSTSTKSAICRMRPRARCFASWSSRSFNELAAGRRWPLMCASSHLQVVTSSERCRRAASGRTCFIA
jgi:two-component system nitrogen regulation response regulator NtrX